MRTAEEWARDFFSEEMCDSYSGSCYGPGHCECHVNVLNIRAVQADALREAAHTDEFFARILAVADCRDPDANWPDDKGTPMKAWEWYVDSAKPIRAAILDLIPKEKRT